MQKPRAIIFDLDGVLTDTSEYHYQSWKRLADEEGIPFTKEENDQHLRGVGRKESLTYLLKGRKVSDAQFQEMMDRKNRYYTDLIKKMTPNDLVAGGRPFSAPRQRIASASQQTPARLIRLGGAAGFSASATKVSRSTLICALPSRFVRAMTEPHGIKRRIHAVALQQFRVGALFYNA